MDPTHSSVRVIELMTPPDGYMVVLTGSGCSGKSIFPLMCKQPIEHNLFAVDQEREEFINLTREFGIDHTVPLTPEEKDRVGFKLVKKN
jgi:CO dehydrogenase nickel-insertion accessory protein CooC1